MTPNRYLLLRQRRYSARLKSITPPANLLAYWPLNEVAGTQVTDTSGSARHGTYSGATLAANTFWDNTPVPIFDGVNDTANVFGASLASVFPATTGSLACWVKIPAAGWTLGSTAIAVRLEADANNVYQIDTLGVNRALRLTHLAGGTAKVASDISYVNNENWLALAMTWDTNRFRGFINGVQIGATLTGLGTFTGALTKASIGSDAASDFWLGHIAHVALWNVELTPSQISLLGAKP